MEATPCRYPLCLSTFARTCLAVRSDFILVANAMEQKIVAWLSYAGVVGRVSVRMQSMC